MHKIKKGIKKKVKGKKNKDSEIFTPEEYERYKKQKEEEAKQHEEQNLPEDHEEHSEEEHFNEEHHQQETPPNDTQGETSSSGATTKEGEDWRKFFSATDTVLKKTSENLEHIKESSYFQKKVAQEEVPEVKPATSEVPVVSSSAPGPPSKRWVDLDKGGLDDTVEGETEEEKEDQKNDQEESVEDKKEEHKEPPKNIVLKPIEDLPIVAPEDYADVFDTTYVDTVESGEIQLYQIPDSPTEEDLNEPDPFDTSNVDKVLHIEKEEEPQAPVTKTEKAPLSTEPQKKKKKILVNLGCAVEVLTGKATETAAQLKKAPHKEVDLLADFEEQEEQTENSEHKTLHEEDENLEGTKEEKCALDEILFGEELDSDLPEFAVPPKPCLEPKKKTEDDEEKDAKETEDTFTEDLAELLDPLASTQVPTTVKKESHLKDLVAEFDVIESSEPVPKPLFVKSDDIVDNIKDEIDAEFAALAAESIAKEKEKEIDEIGVLDDNDPFDTSAISKVLGETDIKEEIPEEDKEKDFEEEKDPFDVDFANEFIEDQRKPKRPPKPARPSAPKASPLSLLDDDPFDTSVATKVLPSDPFETVDDILSLPETLKPQASEKKPEDSDTFDPFDTSVAESFGKTELKVLEGELLSDITDKGKVEADSDFDFNPRQEEEIKKTPLRPPSPACLLTSADENPEAPVLAPQASNKEAEKEEDNFDPFDTSFAEKVHIKSLEAELLSDIKQDATLKTKNPPPRPVSPTCALALLQTENSSVAHISSIAKKTLAEDFDPFDTSIADSFDSSDKKEAAPFSRDNSRKNLELDIKPPRPASPVCLLATTPLDENPTLEPVAQTTQEKENDFDPFDTSIAEQFGKTELKVLETELLKETPTKVDTDDEFDPRSSEAKSPKPPPPPRPLSPACLLTSGIETEQQLPPLSPLTATEFPSSEDIDPFDTSIANRFGKAEIEKLESDLLSDLKKGETIQGEFGAETTAKPLRPPPPTPCLFSTTPTDNNPSLQPFNAESNLKEGTTAEEIDPFDTSIADQFSKTELKALEQTLLSSEPSTKAVNDQKSHNSLETGNRDSLFDISPSASTLPVLNPTQKISLQEEKEEIDPFDTSIAAKFGKTELKVLESELVDSGTKRNLSDDEFDPRDEESKSVKRKTPVGDAQNLLDSEENLPVETLSPLKVAFTAASSSEADIDPFDTSIAENIGPSHQELKLLDKELLESN